MALEPTVSSSPVQLAAARAAKLGRGLLAFLWLYQGLVPKLLGPHADELTMNLALGVSTAVATQISMVAGVTEIVIGVCVLLVRRAWPLWLTLLLMAGLLGYVMIFTPQFLGAAFNPVTINVAMAGLAWIVLLLEPKLR